MLCSRSNAGDAGCCRGAVSDDVASDDDDVAGVDVGKSKSENVMKTVDASEQCSYSTENGGGRGMSGSEGVGVEGEVGAEEEEVAGGEEVGDVDEAEVDERLSRYCLGQQDRDVSEVMMSSALKSMTFQGVSSGKWASAVHTVWTKRALSMAKRMRAPSLERGSMYLEIMTPIWDGEGGRAEAVGKIVLTVCLER